MSTLSTNIYGSSTNKGIGGLMSGLDTDDLVNQMTALTRNKINREYQAKQSLLYRQEAFRDISTKLLSFSNKYFSYSTGSKTNILSPAFFKSNTIESSSKYVNVTGDAENIKNFSINSISSVATAANFSSSKKVSNQSFGSDYELLDHRSSLAGETMSLEYNDKIYNIKISEDFGKDLDTIGLSNIVDELNVQLASLEDADKNKFNEDNSILKYKLEGDEIVFENGSAKLSASSTKIKSFLNMEVGQEAISKEPITVTQDDLTVTLSEALSNENAYMTFDFNGVSTTIKFQEEVTIINELGEEETLTLTNGENVQEYLQYKLDKIYGEDKVTASFIDGKYDFTTEGSNNLFGITSISKELSYFTGIDSGIYNRVNKTSEIGDAGLADTLIQTELTSGEQGYAIKINDKLFEFSQDASLNDIVKKINSDTDANVNIYYSSTTDSFTVKSTITGEQSQVKIEEVEGGNLATTLFGTKGVDYTENSGTDTIMTYTLNGVETTVNRSTANFSIDGINIDLNENATGLTSEDEPITFDVTHNTDEVVERVKQFIADYNEIIDLIGTKTKEKPNRDYLPLTPEQQDEMEKDEIDDWTTEAKKGILFGDSKMNTVLRSLRESMSGKTSVSDLVLSNIGISSASMDTSGKLVFDEEKFKEKLLQKPEEIASLFTEDTTEKNAEPGIAIQIQELLKYNVGTYGTSGVLIDEAGMPDSSTSDSNYISLKMEKYDDKMEELKKDLEKERERYWSQFTALEKTLSNLNSQSSWLTDMMSN